MKSPNEKCVIISKDGIAPLARGGVKQNSVNQPKADMENKLISQLIEKLALCAQSLDPSLDEKLEQLVTQLQHSGDLNQVLEEIKAVEQHLQNKPATIKPALAELDKQTRTAAENLQQAKSLPNNVRANIREYMNRPASEVLREHQDKLAVLVGFYQQLVTHSERPAPNFLRVQSSADPVQEESTSNIPTVDATSHKRICDELQRLITELDFAGEFGEKLAKIRNRILSGIAPSQLASICLEMINLIIDGTREERKASQAFLYSLNESLNSFHQTFCSSVSESRSIRNEQFELNEDLRARLRTMGLQVDNTNDLLQLKLSIQSQLKEIGRLLSEKEAFEQREKELEKRLAEMENKLSLMKDETSEYKKRLSAQKHKLFLDSLTQVYNRAALDERLELEFKRWQRYDHPLCLAIVDIDHFKSINDNYGHMAGDKALKVIARALQKSLRDTDFIARFGGEEFVLLLPNISAQDLQAPLDNLRESIKSIPFKFKDNRVSITISIGATAFVEGDQPLDAFERADQSLYDAKHQGRDRVILSI
ncbi:GGDEF domain-containing protein [Motilimonas eburnea]|uniref:GGDEF domain-containing protein n=1 Tax=Motilimonas eburnea TaxID=1737488 RepID=UPI001E290764|nr:GGDEF domain-containing protein [Motilimonas eburnea]MCE2569990.1 diguanylate cyclase [Motilimonas eburnea]